VFQLILPFQLDLPLDSPGDPGGVVGAVLSRRVRSAQLQAARAPFHVKSGGDALQTGGGSAFAAGGAGALTEGAARRRKRKVRSAPHE